ncbi:XRE family transcriptional regulator [Streptomyces sp. V2]|uniref:Helix-turn-helix domain-containing protein n=1 Tax=Streptomyces niveiscabiei TaxID=164115 RepID=A0ABW9HIW3_9ACTN|nr:MULTISPECIES: helix-turn-helix transcriptional regulator [Streptomyces]PWG13115.1 XRE family transcriptional regulator [Streptomyces sp. V2]
MSGDGEAARPTTEADEAGWEVDPDDEWGLAVLVSVGRQLRLRREAKRMRVPEFAKAIGYSDDMVYKIEAGARIPKQVYLDRADRVLDAGGLVSAMWEDVEKVRYPKKVRDLARMEAKVEHLLSYGSHALHGLLQTADYARALLKTRHSQLSDDELEKALAGRMARKAIFERTPAPQLSFILEEMALRRPIGGMMVWRSQLEHLLEVGELRNVGIQVMPIDRWDHPGTGGRIQVLKFDDGTAVGRMDDEFYGRPTDDPKHLMVLEMRYGIIRGEARTVRESRVFIERLLGET